jgi:molybdopterin-synthase adenylyltransferase
MTLSDEELERYQRHILLKEVGGAGQAKLQRAKVLVIGAGGLGAPVLMYLAAAGVGTLGVIDDDVVDLSNLQRQIIHSTQKLGRPKVLSAKETIGQLNPNVKVNTHVERLTAENAMALFESYDLIVDGSDNFPTRYLVNDACYLAQKTLVWGAVGQFEGHVSTFKGHEKMPDGTFFPNYRCLFPEQPPDGMILSCEEAGILGALTGIIGSLQAIEAIKEILSIGESLAGRLLIYDALDARFQTIRLNWDPNNPLSGRAPTIRDLSLHSHI